MEDKLSKDLYNLNKEYLELKNLYNAQKCRKLNKAIQLIKYGKIKYLIYTFLEKKQSKNNSINNLYDSDNKETLSTIDGRVAVYMCIVGKYDKIFEPIYISNKCDYYIVTDQEVDKNSIWKKIDINKYITGMKKNELNRYIKLHPHILFENYKYSIYLDGNVRIMSDLIPMVERLGDKIIGVHMHSFRDCAYKEGKSFKYNSRLRNTYPLVKKQLDEYSKEGFPKSYGLFENTIIIRKHLDKDCICLMDEWWKQLKKYSFRDQISLPYVVWKKNMRSLVHVYGILKENYRIRLYKHKV